MKQTQLRIMLALTILCLALPLLVFDVPKAHATTTWITQIQAPKQYSEGDTSFLTGSLSQTPAFGNTLVATVAMWNNVAAGTITSIAQTGVTWTKIVNSNSSGWSNGIYGDFKVSTEIWVGAVSVGASASFNMTTSTRYSVAIIAEYSGVNSVTSTYGVSTAATGTDISTGTATTTTAPILYVGGITCYDADQATPTNGFTLYGGLNNGSSILLGLSYLDKISYASGQTSANATASTSCHWAGAIAAFTSTATLSYQYTFHGIFSETTGDYTTNCNVTAYFDGAPSINFEASTNTVAAFQYVPQFFHFDMLPYSREYWVDPASSNRDITIYNDTTTPYYISFLDYTGILKTYPYVTAKFNVNGSFVTVEQRKVDAQNMVAMNLVNGRKYQLIISGDNVSYTYGDLLVDGTSGIQLILRSVDFPSGTLLTQKFTHIYGVRNFTSPSGITIVYQDEQNLTDSVDLSFAYQNGTVAYSTSSTSQTFSVTWSGAANETTYYFSAIIHHSTFGDLTFNQIFPQKGGSIEPWSLSWLGSLGFNTAYIIPAILILCAAGCFSALNAEVGAILLTIVAIIETWIGWIPIPAGALVTAMFLSILMALIYNKRRVIIY
jgi:hypothetical protein